MHKVYIQYMTLEEAAYEMGKSYSWATTTHSSAKRNVQKILDDLKY